MQVRLCPDCGSGKVVQESPLSTSFVCQSCGSVLTAEKVALGEVNASAQDVAIAVAQTLLVILSDHAAVPIGRAIVGSGICPVTDGRVLGRLIRAGTLGAHLAILQEVSKLQEESVGKPST